MGTVSTSSYSSCQQKYESYQPPGDVFCNWTWDTMLCWPPTLASETTSQSCPRTTGSDPSKLVLRRCSGEGLWEGPSEQGFVKTDYTPCYTKEMRIVIDQLLLRLNSTTVTPTEIFKVAERTRTLEIIGFSISLVALLMSLFIFFRFTSLRNNRTRIHRNLFVAMVIQVVIRLTLYIDQFIVRGGFFNNNDGHKVQGIENTPVLCKGSYVLLEYARTAMFMWMFIEGLYLHNKITVTVFHERSYYAMFSIVGWGMPVVLTAIWASATAWHYGNDTNCWFGYNLTAFFWILEGPRLGVVLLNFLFLLNIIRVLVVKLQQSHTSEIEQVRKAVRAAVVLVPLLGITNILNMMEAPMERSVLEFALWSYTTHFLTSFQGFFIAFLYCFLNGEVRTAVMKSITVYFSLRTPQCQARRNSGLSGLFVTAVENAPDNPESEMLSYANQENLREHPRRQRQQRKQQSRWMRLCCRGKQSKPPDRAPHETRV